MAELPIASDGMVARPSHAYAEEKLYFVGRYQDIFATGMSRKWSGRVYYDLLAGPGRGIVKGAGTEFRGSPVLSLAAPFTRRIFVEADPVLADALRRRIPAEAGTVIEGDCNASAVIDELRASCPSRTIGLAFVDNLGLDVPLATLRRLTHGKAIDLMIVFQVQDLTRNILDVLEGWDDRARVDAFFGDVGWETVARDAFTQGASSSEVASALLGYYQGCLSAIGYAHTAGGRRPMRNSRNATQYRLLLAGKHERAVDFFEKIQAIDPGGQRTLFQS